MNSFSKELRELLRLIGLLPLRVKPFLIHLSLLAAFGVLLPWSKGVEFMDPALPTIYACLGPFFAAPVAVRMLQDSYPESGMVAARILAATLYGEIVAVLSLFSGFATVLLAYRNAYLYLPDPLYLGKALLMGLGATFALTSITAWLTLNVGRGWAMGLLRLVFVALLYIFFLKSWWLPSFTGTGALVSFAVALTFLALLRREPKRP